MSNNSHSSLAGLPPAEPRRPSLVTEIQAQLRDYIFVNGLKPGDMLPPAAEMSAYLGVSAATLREGLRALEALGILEIRHGVGTFVRAYNLTPILENLSFSLLFEAENLVKLIQIREAMEVGLIREAVACMDDETVAELKKLLQEMTTANARSAVDIDFHRMLYRPLNNELIAQFLDIFWMVHTRLFRDYKVSEPVLQQTWRDHERIFLAVQQRDADAAIDGLLAHFGAARSRITNIP